MHIPGTRSYDFIQVDVFTDHVFGGNPLAVFPHAEGLSGEEMGRIAREMNLSETTFVLPAEQPGCAWRVRIFTPGGEVPFAGHPTIGTTWALAALGMLPAGKRQVDLEERVGPIPVRLEGDPSRPERIWMRHPAITWGPAIDDRAMAAGVVGLGPDDLLPDAPALVGSTGLPFLYIPVRDRETVDRAALDERAFLATEAGDTAQGVFVFAPDGPERAYSRMLGRASLGVPEDPATGSASGPLGAYFVRQGLLPPDGESEMTSEQGAKMGRRSLIAIRVRSEGGEAREIEIGGEVVPVLEGRLTLP